MTEPDFKWKGACDGCDRPEALCRYSPEHEAHFCGICWKRIVKPDVTIKFEEDMTPRERQIAQFMVEEAREADMNALRPVVCRCWNEGQYGRVRREDCPLHSDEAVKAEADRQSRAAGAPDRRRKSRPTRRGRPARSFGS